MSAAGQKLVALATAEFLDLTEAEKKLLRHAAAGDMADYRGPTAAENDPNHAETWGRARTIRAKIIRWLCVDRDAIRHIDPAGIRIDAAKIDGQLDLKAVTVPFPLVLIYCSIRDGIQLRFAETRLLVFDGSSLATPAGNTERMALTADGIHVNGDVLLRRGFQAEGAVLLLGATITGALNCCGGKFLNRGGSALIADSAHVGTHVDLSEGFQAEGAVRLLGATITGGLACRGGKFLNRGGSALIANSAHVGTDVVLGKGFKAVGEVGLQGAVIAGTLRCDGRAVGGVRLTNATIAGDLNCEAGAFYNPSGTALMASTVKVGGNVLLRGGFRAVGRVVLTGAMITGSLSCEDGIFLNPDREALIADGVKIGGHAVLTGFQVEGCIRLVGGSIGGNLDCSGARFIGCRYNGLRARGMTVTGLLDWRRVTKNSTTLLDLSLARVGQLADDAPSWPERGNLRLDGFVYTTIADDGPTGWKVRRDWLERQPHASAPGETPIWPHKSFSPQPYQQLAKVLRESGHEAAAKRILIVKEKARRKHGELGWWAWGGVCCWAPRLAMGTGHGKRYPGRCSGSRSEEFFLARDIRKKL